MSTTEQTLEELGLLFHHVHVYMHRTKPLSQYKALEDDLNKLAHLGHYDPFSGGMRFLEPKAHSARVAEGRKAWQKIRQTAGRPEDLQDDQDFIDQLIVGLGWRVTASYVGQGTTSYLVTSSDSRGIKICVTSLNEESQASEPDLYEHFDASNLKRFFNAHNNRQGIAVLSFEVGPNQLDGILHRYRALHPALLATPAAVEYRDRREVGSGAARREVTLGSMRVVEAYAYYLPAEASAAAAAAAPDLGTRLRFVERAGSFAERPGFGNPEGVLPGLRDADARFDGTSAPAYSDHWVSNVIDRASFLHTVAEVLGLTPKVHFNAGVIGAGRAAIESTVVGNASAALHEEADGALRDRSQVFLPTNNALTPHGHVHTFLAELGQGVQHVACRVADLVAFVERVDNYRAMTGGGGLRFLRIPRSYYGALTPRWLAAQGVPPELVGPVLAAAAAEGLADGDGLVDLDVTGARIARIAHSPAFAAAAAAAAAGGGGGGEEEVERLRRVLEENLAAVKKAVKRARYSNLYELLGERLTEEEYIHTVRNQILIDVQAGDVLFQIFTDKVLRELSTHEAPFLEFIQRSCERGDGSFSRPGCGGFGIRNFLTLFLSIELSKALADRRAARAAGDAAGEGRAARRAELFARQLDESNPVLTAISDAMWDESQAAAALERAREAAAESAAADGVSGAVAVEAAASASAAARARKEDGTRRLQELSVRYDALMRAVAEEEEQAAAAETAASGSCGAAAAAAAAAPTRRGAGAGGVATEAN